MLDKILGSTTQRLEPFLEMKMNTDTKIFELEILMNLKNQILMKSNKIRIGQSITLFSKYFRDLCLGEYHLSKKFLILSQRN